MKAREIYSWNTVIILLCRQNLKSMMNTSNSKDAMLKMARLFNDPNLKVNKEGLSFAQQYLFDKGIKAFGQKGRDAPIKEMDQLYYHSCFTPISVAKVTPTERRNLQQAIMFLGEKPDGTIKGRMVYNEKPTREWLSREESPTAALKSIILTEVIDAHKECDIMTCNILLNAFTHALMLET